MENPQREDIVITIILASILIVILAVSMLLFFLLFVKKKQVLLREKDMMQANFEQTLLQTQLEIQEQTLRNISHEIHDNIGQILSLVSLNLNILSCNNPDKLLQTEELVTKAITDLRDLSKSLNPERLQQVGLKEAIEHELQNLEKTEKYSTNLIIAKDLEPISPEKTIILYRMVQETLNNIIKHASATTVKVIIAGNTISIMDNGKGFIITGENLNGMGLQNIQTRAKLINASADIVSDLNQGTTVIFTINRDFNV